VSTKSGEVQNDWFNHFVETVKSKIELNAKALRNDFLNGKKDFNFEAYLGTFWEPLMTKIKDNVKKSPRGEAFPKLFEKEDSS